MHRASRNLVNFDVPRVNTNYKTSKAWEAAGKTDARHCSDRPDSDSRVRVHHHAPLPAVSERLARPRVPRLPMAEVVPFFSQSDESSSRCCSPSETSSPERTTCVYPRFTSAESKQRRQQRRQRRVHAVVGPSLLSCGAPLCTLPEQELYAFLQAENHGG